MLTRQLDHLNKKIDILYRRKVGETREAIAGLYSTTRQQVERWEKQARLDPKVVQSVEIRMKHYARF